MWIKYGKKSISERAIIVIMVSHAVWKTWPSGLSYDKNLGLQPRFLSTESLGPCFSHGMGDHDQILHPIFQSTMCCCQCPDSCAQERTSCGLPQSEHRLSPWCSLGLLAMVKGHVVELRQAGGHDIRHWSIGHIIYGHKQAIIWSTSLWGKPSETKL